MTSNIGARHLKDFVQGVGFATKARKDQAEESAKGVIRDALKKTFAPEFLNRIDDVVIFNSLEREEIFKIIDITLKDVFKRLENLGYHLELTDKAKDFVAEKGYDPQFGARPLNRAIQKYIEDPLAEFLLNENPAEGTHLQAAMNKEEDGLEIKVIKAIKTDA